MSNSKEEYYFLKEKLDEINWALNGSCNDIDCDKYTYKDLLKAMYKPVLKHSFSCIQNLKREKTVIMRILSLKRYKRCRYTNCYVCKKRLDKLSDKSTSIHFTRPSENNNSKCHELRGEIIHKKCKKKVKTPRGWKNIS